MSVDPENEFTVLHTLKVRGLVAAEPLAEATGIEPGQVQQILDAAVEQGQARSRSGGRVEGYMLTKDGRERHAALRSDQVTQEQQDALGRAYEAFLGPNREFKQITTDWQTKAAGDVSVVLPRLTTLNEELGEVLGIASSAVPRMSRYQPRFDAALKAFGDGDGDALAKPMAGSYHDAWMELHEDLLLTLGRERTDDDE